MNGACAVHCRTRRCNLLQHDRRLPDPASATAELLRDRYTDPTRSRERLVELPRKPVLFVETRPIRIGEIGAHASHGVADQPMFFGFRKVHRLTPLGIRSMGNRHIFSTVRCIGKSFAHAYSPTLHTKSTSMAGKYFEELTIGDMFTHRPSRTVTETDN